MVHVSHVCVQAPFVMVHMSHVCVHIMLGHRHPQSTRRPQSCLCTTFPIFLLMNQYLAQTEVETFNITKDQQLVKLSPQDLQGQITHKCIATIIGLSHNHTMLTQQLVHAFRFLLEADTDKDGKISTEEFNAFTLKHPMTLVGLIHMHTILLNLLQHCKWIQNQEKQGTSDYPACPST